MSNATVAQQVAAKHAAWLEKHPKGTLSDLAAHLHERLDAMQGEDPESDGITRLVNDIDDAEGLMFAKGENFRVADLADA